MTESPDKLPQAKAETAARAATVSRRQKRRLHARLLRHLWHLGFTLLVLLATYLTAGRLLMPLVGGQIAGIEAQLSQLLGATVTIGGLRGSWFRFGPNLEIDRLTIAAGSGADRQLHSLSQAILSLDVTESLLRGRPVIASITATDLQLTLQQRENGSWTLAGLASGGTDYSQQIIDFMLRTRDIALTEAAVRIRRRDGSEITLDSLYLELQNSGGKHDLRSQFRINRQQSPTQLLANIEGDPRDVFSASVYAGTSALDLTPLLGMPQVGGWQLRDVSAGGRVWLELDHNGLQRVRSTIAALQAHTFAPDGVRTLALENASFTLAAWPVPDAAGDLAAWGLQLNDMAFDWQQTPWEIPVLQLIMPRDASASLTVRAGALELGMLSQLATTTLPVPANVTTILDTLNPRGFLRNVHFETARDGTYPGAFLLRANLADVAVEAWNGAPAGSGLQGYVQAEARSGFVEVDSRAAAIHLPRLFNDAWQYERLNTRVQWDVRDDGFRVSSNAIEVENSGLHGHVQFDLYSNHDPAGTPFSELTLLIGMERMDVAQRSAYLPAIPRLRPTMDWLNAALQGGAIHDSGFFLRTSTLANAAPDANTFATWYHVSEGRLQFLPEWPSLTDITADVLVRDGIVRVQTTTASIAGIALDPATGNVDTLPDGSSLLSVRGTARADTGTGLDFLRDTPVRDAIGPFIDNWQASGSIGIDVALAIPLGADAEERSAERIIDVNVLSTASELQLPDYALTISDINGRVSYHSTSGLAASGLSARLFDFPIVAGIETLDEQVLGRSTRITSRGRASVSALQAWQQQPAFVRDALDYMSGEVDYTATLDIRHDNGADGMRTRLDLASDLLGVQSSLPVPFGKATDEAGNLQLTLGFLAEGQELTARYGDFLSGSLVLDAGGIDRGQLYFGDRNRTFNVRQSDASTPGLLINGDLPFFNYEQWQAVADALSAKAEPRQRSLAEYLRLVDVNLDQLEIAGQEFANINVQVQYDAAGWQIEGTNTLLGGHFTIPVAEAEPWQVTLDYLRFPPSPEPEPDAAAGEAEPVTVDLLSDVDPTQLPSFDFTTAELSLGPQNLGAFSFSFRPDNSGATISDFRMQAEDSAISDIPQTGGANLDWRYRAGMHTSSYNGLFVADNLAEVLTRWGHDANIESERARFSGTLQWVGSPLAFALSAASGQLLLDIRDGRFVDIEAGTARVFGALNFDALVRRLQLDFSDIFQSGYTFDRISGNLNLKNGVVTTNGAILIDGPSSRISINGEIDLARETIAADMEVQIPLGQSLSMLAGILGAWPIALSTYLANLIFADQVADFATVIYRLEGPWENPAAGFEAPETATEEKP